MRNCNLVLGPKGLSASVMVDMVMIAKRFNPLISNIKLQILLLLHITYSRDRKIIRVGRSFSD